MPVLGINISRERVIEQREALLLRILSSSKLKSLGKLQLTRQPYTGDYILMRWTKEEGFDQVATFGMLPFPGCRAICVFHHSQVELKYRGKGIGKELLRIRMEAAKQIGYKVLLATVRIDNHVERELLNDMYWMPTLVFGGTFGTNVEVWTKSL